MRRNARAVFAMLVVLSVAVIATTTSAANKPIIIGWAIDLKGNMSPIDDPALASAQVEVKKVNAAGGVNGRPLKILTCDTQNSNPAKAKSCALGLLAKGAVIGMVTCDVEFAAPATQAFIGRGTLAVAPCIGTDQQGPKRFGPKGKLAFSFGNIAQNDGAAMAEYAYNQKHWTTAALVTNNLLVYFKQVVQAFDKRFTQLGGKVVARESFTTGQNDVGNAVSRLNTETADVIVTSTSFGELPGLVSGLRSLGNQTPIINSVAGDGTYWNPKTPQVTNYYSVTYASVFGDDPSPAVNALAKQVKAATGNFVTGAGAIDGLVTAIKRSGGSTNGATLAATLVKFKNVPTISGPVSFSARLHGVTGRIYRVVEINNNQGHLVGTVRAKVVPTL